MRFALDILPAAIAHIAEAARWYEDQHEALGAEFALVVSADYTIYSHRQPGEPSPPVPISLSTQERALEVSPTVSIPDNRAAPVKNHDQTVLPPGYNNSGGIAPGGTRSLPPCLTKAFGSSPARLAAPFLKSERTIAREATDIRLIRDGVAMPTKKGKPMKLWQRITHYAGFDWARDHGVVLLDQQAHIVADFLFEHTGRGIERSHWQLRGD
jgi:hypothetical protein